MSGARKSWAARAVEFAARVWRLAVPIARGDARGDRVQRGEGVKSDG